VDIDAFFPRCYDLNDQEDFDNFMEEFKTSKVKELDQMKIFGKFGYLFFWVRLRVF